VMTFHSIYLEYSELMFGNSPGFFFCAFLKKLNEKRTHFFRENSFFSGNSIKILPKTEIYGIFSSTPTYNVYFQSSRSNSLVSMPTKKCSLLTELTGNEKTV